MTTTNTRAFLLIARKNGSSSSRRQRAFPTMADVDRAITRWTKEGFNTWWLYGTALAPSEPRPLLREWQDATTEHDPTRFVINEDDDNAPRREPTHPATGEPTNAARAARVDATLAVYAQDCRMTDEPPETVAQDFITDVLHWLAQRDLDGTTPRDVAASALAMFEEETTMESDVKHDPTRYVINVDEDNVPRRKETR